MALLFMEGFDGYTSMAEALQRRGVTYEVNNPESWGDITTGRISGKAADFGYDSAYVYYLPTASTATTWWNVAIQVNAWTTQNNAFLTVQDSAGAALYQVQYNGSTKLLQFVRGTTTVLGSSTNPLQFNTWHSVGVECFVNDTTGTVKVWLDGNLEIDLTGQDTKPGTTTTGSILVYGSQLPASQELLLDDVIFGDDSGSDLTAYPGDCHIEMLLPDSDGTTNDWTPVGTGTTNADRVDENPTDDDTTYVHSSTATHKDLYGFAALTETADTYLAVQLHLRARKEGTGYREVNATMRSNVTEVDGDNLGLTITYLWFTYLQENDPNGGINWTESAINAMQAGIELTV